MITATCAALLAIAALARKPSPERRARKRIAQWKRERLELNPALRGRR
jgi:hypothetical protein